MEHAEARETLEPSSEKPEEAIHLEGRRKVSHSEANMQPSDTFDSAVKQRKRKIRKADEDELAFACPFFARDPQNGEHDQCSMVSFRCVTRLKSDHIRNFHFYKNSCPRCKILFEDSHVQHDQACKQKSLAVDNLNIGPASMSSPTPSRSARWRGLKEEEKWRSMYRFLFPEDAEDQIPSPYHVDSFLRANAHRFFAQVPVVKLRQELTSLTSRVLCDTGDGSAERIVARFLQFVSDTILGVGNAEPEVQAHDVANELYRLSRTPPQGTGADKLIEKTSRDQNERSIRDWLSDLAEIEGGTAIAETIERRIYASVKKDDGMSDSGYGSIYIGSTRRTTVGMGSDIDACDRSTIGDCEAYDADPVKHDCRTALEHHSHLFPGLQESQHQDEELESTFPTMGATDTSTGTNLPMGTSFSSEHILSSTGPVNVRDSDVVISMSTVVDQGQDSMLDKSIKVETRIETAEAPPELLPAQSSLNQVPSANILGHKTEAKGSELSSKTLQDSEIMEHQITLCKQQLLKAVVCHYRRQSKVISSLNGDASSSNSVSFSSGPNSGASGQGSSSANGGQDGTRKRLRRARDDGEEGDGSRLPLVKRGKVGRVPAVRPLACPFLKQDPLKYGHLPACNAGWLDVNAMKKSHLTRRHKRPPQCPKCWTLFDSFAAKEEHMGGDCEKVDEPKDDRIRNVTWATISGQNKFDEARNEEQKWSMLYRIIFPLEQHIPLPYYENDAQKREKQRDLYHEELPRLFLEKLHERLNERLAPFYQALLTEVPMILGECFIDLAAFPEGRDCPNTSEVDSAYQSATSASSASPAASSCLPSFSERLTDAATQVVFWNSIDETLAQTSFIDSGFADEGMLSVPTDLSFDF